MAYTENFFSELQGGSYRSAKEIVPLVLELVRPESVIDIGCGAGTWLSVFKEFGIEEICGVDGDYVNAKILKIPKEQFLSLDLSKPFHLGRQFDLVLSLEVAEHLPPESAGVFIDSLTKLGPIVLFSAAIPHQGGTQHMNEQWPDYWAKLFQHKGYVAIDCIRKTIWQNSNVEWWYAQNLLLFVRTDYLDSHLLLKRAFEETGASQLSIVHPEKYLILVQWIDRLYSAARDIAAAIPPGEEFILVDDDHFGGLMTGGRHIVPFLQREGQYQGPPPDDETAILETKRLRQSGASFIVFAWPAFWWFDSYRGFKQYLRSNFYCTLDNDRLVAFDMRREPNSSFSSSRL